MSSRFDKSEAVIAGLVSIVYLLLTSLPYLAGYAAQNEASVFSGAALDRQDYAVHLASMQLGARGEWQYQLQFTAEPHPGAYVKLGYVFLGHVARWLGMTIPGTYQLGRIAFGLAACLAVYWLLGQILFTRLARLVALGLALFGSGLGWLEWLFHWSPQAGVSPIDFWLIDPYLFLGGMAFPHFSLITALLAIMTGLFLHLRRGSSGWLWGLLALCAAMSQLIQPFAPFVLDLAMAGVLGLDLIKGRKNLINQIGGLCLVGLAQMPLLIYNQHVFTSNPVWAAFSAQNITLSPKIEYYLFGFGIFWPFAILGLVQVVKNWTQAPDQSREYPQINMDGLGLVAIWCGAALLLAFWPLNIQRRFMQAYTLPLGILASAGFIWLVEGQKHAKLVVGLAKHKSSLGLGFVLLSAISSLYLGFGLSLQMPLRPAALFDPAALVQAVDWLPTQAVAGEVVLASEQTSQLVAARTGLRVYFGHPIETIAYQSKARLVENFYAGRSDQEWISRSQIGWVIYGPAENNAGRTGLDYPFLRLAFQNNSVKVYQVTP